MKTEIRITFDTGDACELFHIINSRGFSKTRSKLLEALYALDRDLAERINQEDNKLMQDVEIQRSVFTR